MDRVDLLGLCVVILSVGLIVTNMNFLNRCNNLDKEIKEIINNAIVVNNVSHRNHQVILEVNDD